MKSRIVASVIILLYTSACSGTGTHVRTEPATMSLCSLEKDVAKGPDHELVRLKVEYVTDLRHGAFFVDPRCPASTLQRGPDRESISSTVSRFDDDVTGDILNHAQRRFVVEVVGRVVDENQKPCFKGNLGLPLKCFLIPEKIISYQRAKKLSGE